MKVPFAELAEGQSLLRIVCCGEFPNCPEDKSAMVRGLNDEMWELMEECWAVIPSTRRTASNIVDRLQKFGPELTVRVKEEDEQDEDEDEDVNQEAVETGSVKRKAKRGKGKHPKREDNGSEEDGNAPSSKKIKLEGR